MTVPRARDEQQHTAHLGGMNMQVNKPRHQELTRLHSSYLSRIPIM